MNAMKFELIEIKADGCKGKVCTFLNGSILIGRFVMYRLACYFSQSLVRDSLCDVQLPINASVSRQQAKISIDKNKNAVFIHLSKSIPSFINEIGVELTQVLANGDLLSFGGHTLMFKNIQPITISDSVSIEKGLAKANQFHHTLPKNEKMDRDARYGLLSDEKVVHLEMTMKKIPGKGLEMNLMTPSIIKVQRFVLPPKNKNETIFRSPWISP
jgi:hypothetical protein